MSTNAEIGDRLRAERQRIELTQTELAEKAGVSKTSQVNYESGMRAPDALYLHAVGEVGIDVLYVVTGAKQSGDAPADHFVVITQLAVLASAGNGFVNDPSAEEPAVSGLCFSRAWLTRRSLAPRNLRVIQVRGASMQPVLSHGDQVLVDQSDTHPKSGFVYVLRQGDELLVKYCQLLPGGILRVSSANPAFESYDVDLSKAADVSVIGRVVASMHDW